MSKIYLFFLRFYERVFTRAQSSEMSLHPPGEFISDEIRRTKTHYELAPLAFVRLVCNTRVFVDIGANLGNHSHFLYRSRGEVFAFEPVVENYLLLKQNVPEAHCLQVALGASEGTSSFTYYRNSMGNGHIVGNMTLGEEGTEDSFQVEIKTLDSYEIQNPTLVKIDVEGSEMSVLLGGAKTFLNSNAKIWMEIHSDATLVSAQIPYTRSEIRDQLVSVGYKSFLRLNGTNFLFSKSILGIPIRFLARGLSS